VLILTGGRELLSILVEVSGEALEILPRVGEYLVSLEDGLDGVEAFNGSRLYQKIS
jgi:hypothetical protein